jgi:hypothetical protein
VRTARACTAACALLSAAGAGWAEPPSGAGPATQPSFGLGARGTSAAAVLLEGERYFGGGRLSLLAGLGYIASPSSDENLPGGATGSVACRLFTRGLKHRAFVEASVSELVNEWWYSESGAIETGHRYGPGLQLGYQHISADGFTVAASMGVGYASGARTADEVQYMWGLSLSHTWRRPPPTPRAASPRPDPSSQR